MSSGQRLIPNHIKRRVRWSRHSEHAARNNLELKFILVCVSAGGTLSAARPVSLKNGENLDQAKTKKTPNWEPQMF